VSTVDVTGTDRHPEEPAHHVRRARRRQARQRRRQRRRLPQLRVSGHRERSFRSIVNADSGAS
jgi:hypothetical protein